MEQRKGKLERFMNRTKLKLHPNDRVHLRWLGKHVHYFLDLWITLVPFFSLLPPQSSGLVAFSYSILSIDTLA